MIRNVHRYLCIALLSLFNVALNPAAQGASGPLGIDHRLTYDDSGIWNRNVQYGVLGAMILSEGAIALYEGGDSRLGKTAWKAIDSTLVGGASVALLKFAFRRERPEDTENPNRWFKDSNDSSFPSGEVTLTTAIVTPFILEYRRDYPWVYALELLPAYDAIARLKTQGHWQSDVLAGFALGTLVGYQMHKSDVPITLNALPHGFYAGFKKQW